MSESNDRTTSVESLLDDGSGTDAAPIEPAEPERVLETVFNLRPVDLQVYRELLEMGQATSDDLAQAINRHRSYVNRALGSLRQCNLVERRRQLLTDGGYRYVYVPRPRTEARQGLAEGINEWAQQARTELDELI